MSLKLFKPSGSPRGRALLAFFKFTRPLAGPGSLTMLLGNPGYSVGQ